MFRKSDLNRPSFLYPPVSWSEPVMKVSPSLDDDGNGVSSVSFPLESCEARSKQQLSPQDVNMKVIVETGQTIDPSQCLKIFQTHDVSELEQYRENFGTEMFEFLSENKSLFIKEDK